MGAQVRRIDKKRGLGPWLVYPQFQLAIVGVNLSVLAAGVLGMLFMGTRTYRQLREMGSAAGLPDSHVYFEFVTLQQQLLNKNLMVGGGILLVVSTAFLLLVTHRIAGPIVRLRGFLIDYVENGRSAVTRLSFRKGDFLSDLPPQVNRALGLDEKKRRKAA